MTEFLDADALIQLLADEPHAGEVVAVLARQRCAVTTVNLAEAAYTVAREEEIAPASLRSVAEARMAGLIGVAAVGEEHAWAAAELRNRYYHRKDSKLSPADCILLAAAGPGDSVVTSDGALARAARAEGIEVVGLPDPQGRRP